VQGSAGGAALAPPGSGASCRSLGGESRMKRHATPATTDPPLFWAVPPDIFSSVVHPAASVPHGQPSSCEASQSLVVRPQRHPCVAASGNCTLARTPLITLHATLGGTRAGTRTRLSTTLRVRGALRRVRERSCSCAARPAETVTQQASPLSRSRRCCSSMRLPSGSRVKKRMIPGMSRSVSMGAPIASTMARAASRSSTSTAK
jgi:hypothetical protein